MLRSSPHPRSAGQCRSDATGLRIDILYPYFLHQLFSPDVYAMHICRQSVSAGVFCRSTLPPDCALQRPPESENTAQFSGFCGNISLC